MKKLLPILLLAVLLAGCPVPQPQNTPAQHWKEIDPATGKGFYLYVPSNYSDDKPTPMIISCHGTPPYDVAEHHIREWKMLGEQNGCIVVAPELIGTDGVLGDGPLVGMIANERRILSIISLLGYRYNIDRKNVMITGFSGGGFPTYWVGLRHPDIFSTVVARNCNFNRWNLHGWYPKEAMDTKVMVYYGENDPGAIQTQSENAVKYLRSQGFAVEKRVVPGKGHQRVPSIAMQFFRDHWKPAVGTLP
ncbi:MAG: prolyl oligopeptidase family serine peptidase [Phycisphaerae bacterium]